MTLNEALETVSINLLKVLEKIEEKEKTITDKRLLIEIDILKSQIIGCSNLIVGLESKKTSLNKDYIIYEIKNAQVLCKKTMKKIKMMKQ